MSLTDQLRLKNPEYKDFSDEEISDAVRQIKPEYKDYSISEIKSVITAPGSESIYDGLFSGRTQASNQEGAGVSVGDYGRSVASGAFKGLASIGEIAEQVFGVGEDLRDWSISTADDILSGMSPEAQNAMSKEIFSSKDGKVLGEGAGDLNTWGLKIANTLGMQADILVPGGLLAKAGRSALQVGGRQLAQKAATLAAEKKISIEAAKKLVEKEAKMKLGAAAMAGYGTAEAVIGSGASAIDVRQQIMDMPEAILAESPEYQQALAGTGDEQVARQQVAEKAASAAAAKVALPTFLFGAVAGKFYDDIFRNVGGTSRLASAGKGAVVESLQEGPQSAAEHVLSREAIKEYADPSIDPTAGAGAAALEGAALGGIVGGGLGAAGHGVQQDSRSRRARVKDLLADLRDGSISAEEYKKQINKIYGRSEAPTPETEGMLQAQMDAFSEGRKRAVLLTPGEKLQSELPEGATATDLGDSGILIHRADDVEAPALAQDGKLGEVLGYGVNEKPSGATEVVTPRDAEGRAVHDVVTDGRPEIDEAAQDIAGPNGTVERRPVEAAIQDRYGATLAEQGKARQALIDEAMPHKTTYEVNPKLRRETVPTGPLPNIDKVAHEAATSPLNDLPQPTEAQKEAGNYKKGSVRLHGLDISIENPAGSQRNPKWVKLKNHYGYIKGTTGKDKDHLDVFLGPQAENSNAPVVIIDQADAKRNFDEHKVMLGFNGADEAVQGYLSNYSPGWDRVRGVTTMTLPEFKAWIKSGKTKSPLAKRVISKSQARLLSSKSEEDGGAVAQEAASQSSNPVDHAADRRVSKKFLYPKSKDRRRADRRKDLEGRKRVAEMSQDEMRQALLVDDLTGLGNRRAYNESEKLPFQVSIDLDGLKYINDTYGHESGDKLLAEFGSEVQEITGDGYHISGDEFIVQAVNEGAARRLMKELEARANDAEVHVKTPGGEDVTISGIGFSYGIAKDLKKADEKLRSHKAKREAAGLRGKRGEPIPDRAAKGAAEREPDKRDQPKKEVKQTPPQSGVSDSAPQTEADVIKQAVEEYKTKGKVVSYLNGRLGKVKTRSLMAEIDGYFAAESISQKNADIKEEGKPENTAYSRKPKSNKSTVSEIESALAKPLQSLRKSLDINVVQSAEEVPGRHPGDIGGYYANGAVWLVADNLNAKTAAETLAHEAVGHLGIESLLGPQMFTDLVKIVRQQKRQGNKRVLDIIKTLQRNYVDTDGKYNLDERQEAREVLAHIAESKPELLTGSALQKLWAQIKAKVKAWLAKHGFANPENALIDSLIADAARFVQGGERIGDGLNEAPAYSRAGKGPLDEYSDLNRRIREEHITAWDKAKKYLKRQLSPGGLLPGMVFQEKIKRDSEFEVIEFDVAHLIGNLERAIKADYGMSAGKVDEQAQRLLSDVMAGKVDKDVPEKTKTVLLAMRQYIDKLSAQYATILTRKANELIAESERLREEQRELSERRNALEDNEENSDEREALLSEIRSKVARANAKQAEALQQAELMSTIVSNMGEYVNRSYRAFDDKDWAKKVPDEVLNNARRYLLDRYAEDGVESDEAARRAEVILNEILKHGTAYESMQGFIQESKLGAKDLSILKRRKQIAPEIRALLGEYTDPRITFAKSATKMGRLIWNQTFLDRVLDIGMGEFLWTDETKPPDATVQIAADGSEVYAPLNGLWTTPEINQAFKDALGKEQMADWYRTIVQLNGVVKYGKTVLSPTTAVRNWMSAFFFAIANGHFDLRHMTKSLRGLQEYFTHNGQAGKLAYLRELKQLGVVYDTPYAGEMMRLLEDSKMADRLVMGRGRFGFKQALDYATKFYQFGDDFWKIIGFENEKRQWINAGLSEQEAKERAAERVRNTYPTYSMVGKGIQSLRRFPLAGTFVSFPAEIIRTTANMLRYLASDMKDPALRPMAIRRATGLAIASGFAYALQALSMATMGMDDDDDEAVRRMAAPWQRNSNLLYTGRDKDGNIRFIDLSFLDPYNYWKRPIMAILRDQPYEDMASDIAKETLSPFLGTDIAAGAIFEVMANKKESGAPVYGEHDEVVNQIGDIANHLRKNLQPGIASNLERTWKAMRGDVSPSGRKYDIYDEAWAWVGFRLSTLDPKTALRYRAFDFRDAKSQADKKLRDTILKDRDADSDDIRDSYDLTNRLREQAYREMFLLVEAAKKSGMSKSDIMAVLKSSGISAADRLAIMSGDVPKYAPSRRTVKQQADKARAAFGNDAAKEVIKRYGEVASYRD